MRSDQPGYHLPSSEATRGPLVRGTTTASRPRIGRAGPRSRAGCVTCKQRRVRCDEVHPVCGHCQRLQLECHFRPPPHQQRWRRRTEQQPNNGSSSVEGDSVPPPSCPPESSVYLDATPGQGRGTNSNLQGGFDSGIEYASASPTQQPPYASRVSEAVNGTYNAVPPYYGYYPRSGQATPTSRKAGGLSLAQVRRFDVNDIFSDLNTSWAGEISYALPDLSVSDNASYSVSNQAEVVAGNTAMMAAATAAPVNGNSFPQNGGSAPNGPPYPASDASATLGSYVGFEYALQEEARGQNRTRQSNRRPSNVSHTSETRAADDSVHLLHLFRKIAQPPAAILIGGFERWRRLQRYLCKLSEQSRAVKSSLLCVVEFLVLEDRENEYGQDRDACMARIQQRQRDACEELERKLAKHADLKPKVREHLLAAIFLLSWFEVIRDQDSQSSSFPRDLADAIITSDTSWNRHSKQLLSWLNTLDSKATHLGGQHLLLPKSLDVVSHFPTQITSEQHEDGHDKEQDDSELSESNPSPEDSYHSPPDASSSHTHPAFLRLGKVKHIMLNTLVQPALEWYLTSQSYCRRISAHDKHHRKRITSDDEYEVITSCKQLESELFELWDYRPAIISIHAEQLAAVVSPDIATRLEEIFSVYLASFWILFVYLHRVSWWNLPHSALTTRALNEVWQHMQRAYGEEVNGPLRRIIHPSLLWPLFLFGSECSDPNQRVWAVEQLEALGEAKPMLECHHEDTETLPAFKLGFGATRNAKRAATLLRELVKQQEEKRTRVDDRDLSMKLFGCYFSIV